MRDRIGDDILRPQSLIARAVAVDFDSGHPLAEAMAAELRAEA